MTGGLYSSSNAKGRPPSADNASSPEPAPNPEQDYNLSHGSPQGYGSTYGEPQGYEYGEPQGYESSYGEPQGYGSDSAYGEPQPGVYGSPQPGPVYGSPAGQQGPVYGSPQGGVYGSGVVYGPTTPAQPGTPLLEEEGLPPQEIPTGGGSSLARSSAIMAVGTLASRVTGFLRSALLLAALGSAGLGDVFNSANTIPNIVYDILLGGVLTAAHVPLLVRARAKSEEYGEEFEQRLFTVLLLALAGITAVAMAASPLLISLYAHKFDAQSRSIAQLFLLFFLPQVFFYGFAAVASASLNSRGRFGAPMWTPVLNNVVVIAVTAAFMVIVPKNALTPGSISHGQIAFLGIGVTAGVAIQAIGLIPAMRKLGFNFRPRFDFRRDELTQMWRMASWTLIYVLAQQAALIVYNNLAVAAGQRYEHLHPASKVGVGLTPWSTAYAFFQLPYAVVAISIITAVLPKMTQSAAEGKLGQLTEQLREGLRLSMSLMLPAVALLFGSASEITFVLFAHHNTTAAGAEVIAQVLRVYAVALVPFSFLQLLQRGFYALQDTRTPGLIAIGSTAAGALSALVLSSMLSTEHVILGIAAAQGISWMLGCVLSVILLRRKAGRLGGNSILTLMVRASLAAAITLVVAEVAHLLIAPHLHDNLLLTALLLVVVGVIGGGGYLVGATVLRVSEVSQVVGMLRRRLGR